MGVSLWNLYRNIGYTGGFYWCSWAVPRKFETLTQNLALISSFHSLFYFFWTDRHIIRRNVTRALLNKQKIRNSLPREIFMSGLVHYVMSVLTCQYVLLLNRTTWIPYKHPAYNMFNTCFFTLNLVLFANSSVGCLHSIMRQQESEGGPHLGHISPIRSKECKLPGLRTINGKMASTGDQTVPSPLPSFRQFLLREADHFHPRLSLR